MSLRISATEAARNFSELLNRVRYGREEFVIVRGGDAVGQLVPTALERRPTFGELLERLASLDRPDARFADDLADIQAQQPRLEEPPEWRS